MDKIVELKIQMLKEHLKELELKKLKIELDALKTTVLISELQQNSERKRGVTLHEQA